MLTIAGIIGIAAGAVSGALAAGKERMDLFGVVMVAFVTALGGGTLRDVSLGNYPIVWVREPWYVVLVLFTAVITVSIGNLMKYFRQLFIVFDAIGLVVFSILGAQLALAKDAGVIIACVAATITGVAGGITRDLLCDRIPLVFREELYASVSVASALGYVALIKLGVSTSWAIIVVVILGFALRMAAVRFKINLPVFDYHETYYDNRRALRRMVRELRQRWGRRAGIDGEPEGQRSPAEP